MSKKNRKHNAEMSAQHASQNPSASHAAEYRIIKFDLIKVIILNAIYLVAILGLYYANRQSGFLDNWFARALHF